MLIKRGDAEFMEVINPVEFSDEETQQKINDAKKQAEADQAKEASNKDI